MTMIGRGAGLALVLVLTTALAGCLDTTEPIPVVEARVAHAAPGLGTATVILDGVPAVELPAQQAVYFPLNVATHTYRFRFDADSTELTVNHDADINGVVLMDRDQPSIHHYRLARLFGQPRVLVINGDFTTMEPMEVEITGSEETFHGLIAPGEELEIEPAPGEFQIRIRPGADLEHVDLAPFTLQVDDNGFLVIAPLPNGELEEEHEYTRILF